MCTEKTGLEERKQDSTDSKMSYLIFISVTLLAVLAKHNSLQPAQKRRYGRDWKEKNDGGNGEERERERESRLHTWQTELKIWYKQEN